jgi:acetyltransferase
MSLQNFFNVKSVAVVGASHVKSKVGNEILRSILQGGFEGAVYPVNPHADEIEGLRCYPDLKAINDKPDLVVIVVPAKHVPSVMEECASIGVKSVIIISSGFKESGPKGEELEREVVGIARKAGIRFIGPNCLGILIPKIKLNASFAGQLPSPGGIGYLSQSGALLASILDMADARQIQYSFLISMGNKADVDELEVIKFLGDDPETKVIAGYLETVQEGDVFSREVEHISRKKPVLLIKAGETRAGAEAASFHTGKLDHTELAYEVIFRRAGVIRCGSIKDQFDYSLALINQPLPKGPRVAVITNGGGPSILAVDEIERQGLILAKCTEDTQKKLQRKLQREICPHDPVDLLGDAKSESYEYALSLILDDPNTDAVLVVLSPHGGTEIEATAKAIVKVSQKKPHKPIISCFLGAQKVAKGVEALRKGKIPQYEYPERAVSAIKVMVDYARWLSRPKRVVRLFPVNRRKVQQIVDRRVRAGVFTLSEMETNEILEAYGFRVPSSEIANSAEQAARIARKIGFPVVLKICSPEVQHKSAIGGVKVGLYNKQDVMDAFDLMMYRIPKKAPHIEVLGVLVQEMCTTGREIILAMERDPHFGPLMMFGLGGIFLEVLKDVAFHIAPISEEEAKEMLVSTRSYHLLTDTRDREPVDSDALVEGLQRLSQLVTEFSQIQRIEINPYMVGPEGTTPIAVHASINLAK